jgi:glycosyltransferase involved in cell wall biosynthesis
VPTLAVFLTDALAAYEAKGEVKLRYYNPGNVFSGVHFFTPAFREVDPKVVQEIVGNARMVLHPMGPLYPLWGLAPVGPLASALRAARPQVIRAYDPGARGALAVVWGRRLGVPSVVSVHADLDDQRRHERRLRHRARRWLEAYTLPRASRVICVSEYLRRYVTRYGARSVDVIYNRVDAEAFRAGPRSGMSAPPVVLSVSRLVRQKAPECLLRAVRGLDVRLVLIGDGDRSGEVSALIERLDLQDQVVRVPAVPHREIPRFYASADIFALATRSEGFCIPVLEAMAAGLPVVASDIPVIREILGDAGLLVPTEPDAFRDAILRLTKDPALRADLSLRARRRAVWLDGRRMETMEQEVYLSLLSPAPPVLDAQGPWSRVRFHLSRVLPRALGGGRQ